MLNISDGSHWVGITKSEMQILVLSPTEPSPVTGLNGALIALLRRQFSLRIWSISWGNCVSVGVMGRELSITVELFVIPTIFYAINKLANGARCEVEFWGGLVYDS